MNLALSSKAGSLSTYVYPAGYDQTKMGLGPGMVQSNQAGNEGKWVGPSPIALARPVETGLLVPNIQPDAISWSSQYDWVVLADNAAVSATRRFTLWRYDRTAVVNQWALQGSIVCTIPSQGTQGTYTNRGHDLIYEKYTTGTVSISNGSPTLTGSSTTWSADRIFIGSRIGFPTVAGDATTVPVWYEISAVGSDTSITLTQNFAETTLAGGSNYIIEDLRIVFCMVNGVTAANGGMFMVAGLRYENFTSGGLTISAATTTDKIRAVYWMHDGNVTSNATNQSPGGIAADARVSWTEHYVYMLDAAAGQSRFQKTNFRGAMTLTAGRTTTTSNFIHNTGQQAVTGTVSTMACLILCTPGAGGGPRSGVKTLFWITTTRVYSAVVSGVTSASTTFHSGVMTETPPGATTTYPATAAFNSIAYDSLSDRFFVLTSGATAFQNYWTQYREDAGQLDRIIMTNNRQTLQTTADATAGVFPTTLLVNATAVCKTGITYFVTHGTTAITNLLYSLPLGCDWEYASSSNSRVVSPVMSTTGWTQFVAAYINHIEVIGGKTGTNLGYEPGGSRLYYRTSGISDNSGSWTLLDDTGDMSTVPASSTIQFMVEFRTLTMTCIPGRLSRLCVEGAGSAMDSHFQFSEKNTDRANKKFGFRISTAFGTTIPTLYLHITNAVTGDTLVSDNSVTQAGTWEKSTDGGSNWVSYNSTDRANETTYVRITPASIADNVNALPWIALS